MEKPWLKIGTEVRFLRRNKKGKYVNAYGRILERSLLYASVMMLDGAAFGKVEMLSVDRLTESKDKAVKTNMRNYSY